MTPIHVKGGGDAPPQRSQLAAVWRSRSRPGLASRDRVRTAVSRFDPYGATSARANRICAAPNVARLNQSSMAPPIPGGVPM